jgi:anti-sigma factor RsiW
MKDKHWNDEQLIARLYGVGPQDKHLDECPACAHRWEMLRARRQQVRAVIPEVPEGFLLAQRRVILSRLNQRPASFRFLWAPSLAAALMILLIFLMLPSSVRQPKAKQVTVAVSDAQLFQEVFIMADNPIPGAVQPVQSLFEEKK